MKAYVDETEKERTWMGLLRQLSKGLGKVSAEVKKQKGDQNVANEAAFKLAKENTKVPASNILAEVGKFLASDKADAQLIKCTVLAQATPRGLAEFAQQGTEQAALVERLLSDNALMKQMLEAGGAKDGQYGQAMKNYSDIHKASQHAEKGILQRLALAASLELAAPLDRDQDDKSKIDPVHRYLNFEKAYLDGRLDKYFKDMTAWECRMIVDAACPDDVLTWAREMLWNYRPELIDYSLYTHIMEDVPYNRIDKPNPSLNYWQNVLQTGGSCGPYSSLGRVIFKSIGIPTYGMSQQGHAAMSYWTPKGQRMLKGAAWMWGWWGSRSGTDFLLERDAREFGESYKKVLRADWVSDVLGEKKYQSHNFIPGDFWDGVALYQKRDIVAKNNVAELALDSPELAESDAKSQKVESNANSKGTIPLFDGRTLRFGRGGVILWPSEVTTEADKKIVTSTAGVITIPAIAYSPLKKGIVEQGPKGTFKDFSKEYFVRVSKWEKVAYEFEAPKAGKYTFSARVVTVHNGLIIQVAPNDSKEPSIVDVPNSVGLWVDTVPVAIALVKGKNILHLSFDNSKLAFRRFSGYRG